MFNRRALGAGLLAVASVITVSAQDSATRNAAQTMQRKLVGIVDFGEKPATPRRPNQVQKTTLSDYETNAFFTVNGPLFMPEGVSDARVFILEANRVTARAIVDLDKALKPKERSWLDPLAYLTGKVEVTATGVLQAAKGRGVFTLERTTVGGVPVPNVVMQELVTYYSKAEGNTTGIRLDQPFDLPSRIQSVTTIKGLATVVQ